MSNSVENTNNKYNPSNPIIPKNEDYKSLVASKDTIKVGDLFFDSNRGERLLMITEIAEKDRRGNGEVDTYVTLSVVDFNSLAILSNCWESPNIAEFIKKYSSLYIPNFEKYKQSAKEYLFEGKTFDLSEEEQDEFALVHKSNKNALEGIYGAIEAKAQSVTILKNMVSLIISEKRKELDIIRGNMEKQLSIFHKEMTKIMKVIGMIELYLGIEEELFQLQSGTPANIDVPLSLRQLVLYADEELGNCKDGGIDYTQLELFDNWLIEEQNYKILIPEERGIVALKPRRRDKDYHDPYENATRNKWNKQTYFLIRNGENLYRICSPHIGVGETLFPKRKEYENLLLEQNDSKQERFKDNYMKMVLFVQGLIDRTEVFAPIEQGIKVSQIEDKRLNLIYDAELALPDNRLCFRDWRNSINSNVGRGSRIVLIPNCSSKHDSNNYYRKYRTNGEGFFRYYENNYNCPDVPQSGIYTIEEIVSEEYSEKKEIMPCIKYMPNAPVWGWYGQSERKNRVTWVINYDSSWYLNYDRVSLEDIDFYLNSRIERKNYISILPLLRTLRKHLIDEQKKENDFKDLLRGLALAQGLKLGENVDTQINNAIDWWKYKNIWKRPITQDDVKAVRMIAKKLNIKI